MEAESAHLGLQSQRLKKYKLSFYDCISLYCGERVGIDRGACILKFCHRT